MKPTDIRELSDDELADKEAEFKDQLFKLRFQMALGQLDNTMKLKAVKRDLARILTIQNERVSAGQKERDEK